MSDKTTAWDSLSMKDKAFHIKNAVKYGFSKDLNEIKDMYNYIATMEKVAKDNHKNWVESEEESLLRILNSSDYDYKGYYKKYPQSNANSKTHWNDEFKTVYHPTFSEESTYSGVKSQYNPEGIRGGRWQGNAYIPSEEQLNSRYFNEDRTRNYLKSGPEYLQLPKKKYDDGGFLGHLKKGAKKLFNMETFEDKGKFEDLNSKDRKILLDYSKNLNLSEEELEEMYNRGELRPFIQGKINSNFKYEVRENDSPTSKTSSKIERYANSSIYNTKGGVSPNMKYAIPYIEDKEIKVPGVGRVSTNALDSIAKYAQIAGIPVQDAIGLAAQETNFGASLWANMKQPKKTMSEKQKHDIKEHNRAIGNMSYFRNAGIIPAEHIVRDFRYNIVEDPISRNIPPLLHAFDYFKSGNYNTGDKNHTKAVKNKGKEIFENSIIKEWWDNSEFNPKNKNGSNNRKSK